MNFKRLVKDIGQSIDGYMERDPAARSRLTIFFTYPGLHAMLWYRLSHGLWRAGFRFLARLASNTGRWLTGIEIHPAAEIGRKLVIDHGMGVVIGETAVIEDNVTLYHDVTLGGIAPAVDSHRQRDVKRHPTVRCGAIIGSGAQVLRPITVGRCARVGANAVVVKDVAEGATVVGVPARPLAQPRPASEDEFTAYGTPTGDLPDPVARALDGLLGEVSALRARVNELEARGREGSPAFGLSEGEAETPDKPESRADRQP